MFMFENDEMTVEDTLLTIESVEYCKDIDDDCCILQLYPPMKWDLKINVKSDYLFQAYCKEFDVIVENWDFDSVLEAIREFIFDMYEAQVLSDSPSDPVLSEKLVNRIVRLDYFS